MKKFLQFSLLLLSIVVFFGACSEDDDDNGEDFIIDYTALPVPARSFLELHFASYQAASVTKRYVTGNFGRLYTVYLVGNIEVEFDASGDWIEIDVNTREFPESLFTTGEVPIGIKKYVEDNYILGEKIQEVEKTSYGYKVELSNEVELRFNPTGERV